MSSPSKTDLLNYDGLMRANLVRVFGEFDADKRLQAIGELYAQDAVFNEPESSVKGHAAINAAVTSLLATLPPRFCFSRASSRGGSS